MMALSESATKQLEALHQRYRESLPTKVTDISDIADGAKKENYPADKLKELHILVHNLAGSAAMHGFNDVASTARLLDKHLRDTEGIDTTDAEWQALLNEKFSCLTDSILAVTDEEGSISS